MALASDWDIDGLLNRILELEQQANMEATSRFKIQNRLLVNKSSSVGEEVNLSHIQPYWHRANTATLRFIRKQYEYDQSITYIIYPADVSLTGSEWTSKREISTSYVCLNTLKEMYIRTRCLKLSRASVPKLDSLMPTHVAAKATEAHFIYKTLSIQLKMWFFIKIY